MKKEYEMVREFMRTFGQKVPDGVVMPEYGIKRMRDSLICEEAYELYHAETPLEKLDAIVDLLYVVLGGAVDCGFTPEQIVDGFKEVHRSNMSKMWSLREVEDGISKDYTMERPEPGLYIVRRPDGKIVKSPSYSPPNLERIVNATR